MATKTFYVTRDQRHPLYKTRMLTAGQPMPLSESAAKWFQGLGLELSDEKPKKATAPAATTENVAAPVTPPPAAPTATAPKRKAPARRAKKRATAKK